MDKQQKYEMMTEQPVEKVICRMAVPTIISMLVSSFYNMADTYFVGTVNGGNDTSATAAVGIVFSIMAIIQAVGFFFGHGSGNYISHKLGANDYSEAERMAANGFGLALGGGLLIMTLGLIFIEPLSYMLGATKTNIKYVKDYLSIILIGAPIMCPSLVLNNQLRFQGSAAYGMIGISTGAVINIGLDWLFITRFGWEVKGAAIATVISQFVSFCLLLFGTTFKSNLTLNLKRFKLNGFYIKEIFRSGTPSLCRQGLASVATICLNIAAASAAVMDSIPEDDAISAMSIVTRIMFFAGAALIGFGQGFQPVCGFNYGAKRYDRVLKSFRFCVKVSAVFLTVVSAVGFVFAGNLVQLFKDNANVIEYGKVALRMQLISFPFASYVVMSNMMAQNLGRVFRASFLAMARQGLLFIPCVLILTHFFGMFGVQISQAIADLLTFFITVPMMMPIIRELKEKSKENKQN